jgi:Bacterial membrane protein YfhO
VRTLARWGQAARRHESWFAGLALAPLALVTFFPLLRGRVLFERDILSYWFAQVETFVRTVAGGSWPVWDPWVSFGQPMLAQPDTQVLYPFTWLNFVLPLGIAYTVFVLTHLVLSGTGLFRLARVLGAERAGAFVAAGIWMLSGPFLSLANVWHHFAGAAWMPWVLEAAESAGLSGGRPRHVVRWGLLTGLQVLAGSADVAAMTALLAAALVARHLLSRGGWTAPRLRLAGGALVAMALGLGSSAALWVPTLAVARRSMRWSLPVSSQEYWSLHPLSLLQLGLPLFLVDLPLRTEWRQALFEGREPFLESMYVGLPALALAAAAILGRARHRWLLTGTAVLASLVALGRHTFFHAAAVRLVPFLAILRFPQKAMILVALAIALLAGLGTDAWSRSDFWKSRWGFVLALGLAAGVTALALASVLAGAEPLGRAILLPVREAGAPFRELLAPVAGQLVGATLAAMGVLVLAGLAARGRCPARADALIVGLLAVASLVAAHRTLHPSAPSELITSRSPILQVLRGGLGSRVLNYNYGAVPGSSERYLGRRSAQLVDAVPRGWSYRAGVAYGLEQYLPAPMGARYGIFGSFDLDMRGLYPRGLDDLTRFVWALDDVPRARFRLLQLGGVSFVVALHEEGFEDLREIAKFTSVYAQPIRVFQVPDPLPRSYVVDGVRVVPDAAALATLVDPHFDFRREILLAEGLPPHAAEAGSAGEARVVSYLPDRVQIDVSARRAAVVILLDSFDPGWQAWVDGRPAHVLRANLAFRAVPVPAGEHRVELRYRPRAIVLGFAISLLTAVITIAALALVARRRPRSL